jgi:hypothetical protein
MARYRFLQDFVDANNILYQAGTIGSTADVGGTLPTNFVPPAAVDPQDASAAQAFFNAGVRLLPLVRQQWTGIPVNPPTCFWQPRTNPTGGPLDPYREYQLSGPLGAGLGFRQVGGGSDTGAQP